MSSITPLISLITVTYNAQQLLEQTIMSVFNQTYPAIEYIIIDGQSTDGTTDIIRKYETRLALWISEKDKGIYDAMNKGIQLAKGELIGMINAGDHYEPDAVETIVHAWKENPDCGIFHGNMTMLDAEGDFCKVKKPNTDMSVLYKGMSVYHPTFFVKKSVYEMNGLYDLQFRVAADFDFALRNQLSGTKFYYIDKAIATFRMGGFSQTTGQLARIESRDSLYKNGFKEEIAESLFKIWLKKDRKDRILAKGHALLKHILPKKILDAISKRI